MAKIRKTTPPTMVTADDRKDRNQGLSVVLINQRILVAQAFESKSARHADAIKHTYIYDNNTMTMLAQETLWIPVLTEIR